MRTSITDNDQWRQFSTIPTLRNLFPLAFTPPEIIFVAKIKRGPIELFFSNPIAVREEKLSARALTLALILSIPKAPDAFWPAQFCADEGAVFYKQNLLVEFEPFFKKLPMLYPPMVTPYLAPVLARATLANPNAHKAASLLTHFLFCLVILFSRMRQIGFQKAVFHSCHNLNPQRWLGLPQFSKHLFGAAKVVLICQETLKKKWLNLTALLLISTLDLADLSFYC